MSKVYYCYRKKPIPLVHSRVWALVPCLSSPRRGQCWLHWRPKKCISWVSLRQTPNYASQGRHTDFTRRAAPQPYCWLPWSTSLCPRTGPALRSNAAMSSRWEDITGASLTFPHASHHGLPQLGRTMEDDMWGVHHLHKTGLMKAKRQVVVDKS